MFIDIACAQKKKYNQHAYGDFFTSSRFPHMNRIVAVLSDGLVSDKEATSLLSWMKIHSDLKGYYPFDKL